MKKILHLISQYPGKTGSGVYLNELIREANKKGYTQAVVGAIDEDTYINPYVEKENTFLLKFNTEDLPFNILGMSDEMPYKSKRYSDISEKELNMYLESFREIIKEAIKEFQPDLIFTNHLWLMSSLVKDIAGNIKVVGISHGTDIRQLVNNERFKSRVIKGNRKLDLVLALNEEQKNNIMKIYNIPEEKIIIIGGGYNSEIFYPSFEKEREKVKLVYAGKISYSKGLLSIIKAINKIDNKYNIEFVLAGSGTGVQYENIKRLAMESNKDIKLLGELTQKELAEVFRDSDIFLMPSYYEGLSLVTIEALACGLYVISNEIIGLKNFLGEEINKSGIIEYIDSPKLNDIYVPEEKSLKKYEEDFKNTIENKIEKLYNRKSTFNIVKKLITNLSWKNIFNKIEKSIKMH